jgi:hypothetical protein
MLSGALLYAHPGIGLVYDGDHTLYYTDLVHVWKVNTKTGEKEIAIPDIHTHELVMDSEGNLYGEHYWYVESEQKFKNYIWKFDPQGNFEKIRGDQYGENQDFSFVRDRNFSSYDIQQNGKLFNIVKRDTTHSFILSRAPLKHPTWKYISADQSFFFADFPDIYRVKNNQIAKIARNIASSRIPFSIQSDQHSIYGIWTDAQNQVYVALYSGRMVKKIDDQGMVSTVLTTGFFWTPVNGVFDNQGDLWLMEAQLNGRIRLRKVPQEDLDDNPSFLLENILLAALGVGLFGLIGMRIRKVRRRNK